MKTDDPSMSRWKLQSVVPREYVRQAALCSVMVGLVYVLYHGYAVGLELGPTGRYRSTMIWMFSRWKTGALSYGSAYYILRFVVPALSLWILWLRRHRIARAISTTNWLGLAVVVLALMANWIGVKTEHPRLSLLSLVALLWGTPFYLYGWKLARIIWFPVAFLVFCIPLNFIDAPMFKVRILAAKLSAGALNGLGVECVPRATTLLVKEGSGMVISMQLAAPALGNFIMLMCAVAVFAYFARVGILRKFVVFVGVLPAFALATSLTLMLQGLLGLSISSEAVASDSWWLTPTTMGLSLVLVWCWYRLVRREYRLPRRKGPADR